MASLVGAFNTVHTPFCYIPPSRWEDVRKRRSLRADVPEDGPEAFQKAERIQRAFAVIREKLAEARPDVLVIFGDDQREYFDFDNYPAFAVYADAEFRGALSQEDMQRYLGADGGEPAHRTMRGHPQLAAAILVGLQNRGFDPAFCLGTEAAREVGHAFMRPAESVTDLTIPIVPVMINCYFAPQVTAKRCYQLGKAVGEVIAELAADLRVAVIGSGGLWHTPGAPDAYLDEDFDRATLRFLEEGKPLSAAQYFDSYKPPLGDRSQETGPRGAVSTGLPATCGPQGGTREFCNWVAAAATVPDKRWRIIDYIPIYSSPVGAGFAYCEL